MPELTAIARYNRLALRARAHGAGGYGLDFALDNACDRALDCLADALRLSREAGRPVLEAFTRNNMGLVYAQAGRPDRAASCYRTALELLRRARPQAANQKLAQAISANLAAAM